MRAQIVVFDGVEELDAFAPLEVLAGAGELGYPVEARLVALSRGRIHARYGTVIEVEDTFSPDAADVLVVPGGGYGNRAPQGTWAEIQRGTLPDALRQAAQPGLTIASVCSGTMLLAAAGLVKGRRCTTHSTARKDLAAEGGVWSDARVVDDGDIVTSGGVTSGLDLALWLLEREIGSEAAVVTERFLEYERRGTVLRPQSGVGSI